MWQFKNTGYFKYTKGIIFGRNLTEESYYNISFKESLIHSLSHLKIPLIYDADIGHKHPQMDIVIRSIATISFKNGSATIKQDLI